MEAWAANPINYRYIILHNSTQMTSHDTITDTNSIQSTSGQWSLHKRNPNSLHPSPWQPHQQNTFAWNKTQHIRSWPQPLTHCTYKKRRILAKGVIWVIKASKWRMDEHCVKDYCQMYTLEKKKKKSRSGNAAPQLVYQLVKENRKESKLMLWWQYRATLSKLGVQDGRVFERMKGQKNKRWSVQR